MKNELLDNLEADLYILTKDKFHPKHDDLANMVFNEDIPELIKFARKVNETFSTKLPDGTGDQYRGFKIAFETLKRAIYEEK